MAIALRCVDLDGDAYQQTDVVSLSYSVTLLDETDPSIETAITGHTSVAMVVADAIFDTLQTPISWKQDTTGYNFRHLLATSPFTLQGRTYKVAYSLVTGTATVTLTIFVSTFPSSMATGYCTRQDIEDVFGPHNVRKWADIENNGDGAHIGGRIAKAIEVAKNEIDDRLRGGYYTVPFASTPETIRQLAAHYAGVWLYESRGIEDFDQLTGAAIHRLSWHRDHVDRVLRQIMKGERRLDGATATPAQSTARRAPAAVRM